MTELSMHILDVAENGIRAGADRITVSIEETASPPVLCICINDNGKGMDPEHVEKALDPFFTTKAGKKVGLGLNLLAQSARRTGGTLNIMSESGSGTELRAVYDPSHPDMQPMGNMIDTLIMLMLSSPGVTFIYNHKFDGKSFEWTTAQLKEHFQDDNFSRPDILIYTRHKLETGFHSLGLNPANPLSVRPLVE
ncbi:hypothetical protein BVY01_03200 [bacterium I07]|nr:hypothetical protein BVY01_03200 [bacterium I07]